MKTIHILALVICTAFNVFAMEEQPSQSGDQRSPPASYSNDLENPWVNLTRKAIALSAGVYIGYKFIDQKSAIDYLMKIKAISSRTDILDINNIAYCTRVLAGALTYLSVNKLLK
ncbi:MAG: hypothetical protein P4L22_05890 [Candidatus Babeliales bacterium]|nr:hypothetical protein [Candidatus Babeliales bacterium]